MNQFSTNFLGTLHILQSSLTYFRTSSIPGRYIIFSSTAGALGVPGMAPYCATKYAVEGLIESMLYETHAFSVRATLVEPGHIRMDDPESLTFGAAPPAPPMPPPTSSPLPAMPTAHRRSWQPQAQPPLLQPAKTPHPPALSPVKRYSHFSVLPMASPAYRTPHSPSQHTTRIFQWFDAHQPTSCVRATELVWQLGHCAFPPLRLLLGSYAVESVRDRLRCITEEIEDWKHLCFGDGEGGGEGDDDRYGAGGDEGDGDGEGEGEGEHEGDGSILMDVE